MEDIFSSALRMTAVNFAEWIHKNGYAKSNRESMSDKWYLVTPGAICAYYTSDELYKLFKKSEKERLKKAELVNGRN